ncbi:MAG: hypothetical protein RBR50_02245 [Candidatus Izemoplasmatales bacterium]|nr:hypothetical protein [Candidatus Izemoplasmatales bacterium]
MDILAIILVIYGALCILISIVRPPFIMNSKKIQLFEKYLGKLGTTLLILGIGIACLVIGIIIYP